MCECVLLVLGSLGMVELDEKNGKEGGELDELFAHRFLEQYGVR